MSYYKISNWFVFISCLLILGMTEGPVYAKMLSQERVYEPVVLRGEILSAFYNVPIDEIFMYAYHETTKTWIMMPFQIDEMIYAEDPFKPGNEDAWQDFYFIPDDSLLDFKDELVFMVGDLGDHAPDYAWIENEESKHFLRLEIMVCDPNNASNAAFGYLFRSSTIAENVPTPYQFVFDSENQIMENKHYAVRLSKDTGLIEDVIIKPPLGTGIDIFDTQKLRFIGVFDFGTFTIPIGKGGYPAANERDNLYVYDYLQLTKKPVVRLIREVRQTIRFGIFHIDETAFYVKTKFYPYSGTISGGASLDPEKLKEEFDTEEDIYVNLELLRQSWDFNAAASGMKFFNNYNQDVLVDGSPDSVNKTVSVPIKEWTLTTGQQGSMFTHVTFKDTSWQNIELYFYDNQEGGQGDGTVIDGRDTGDSVSFGDQGILFQNLNQDSVSLELGFTAYFLPGNLQKSDGEKLAYWVENPVVSFSKVSTYHIAVNEKNNVNLPDKFRFYQNYPNPFNGSTKITFATPTTERFSLKIIDIHGRTVVILAIRNFAAGTHELYWNGMNEYNQPVASGIYFCEIRSNKYISVNKLILLH